ncbi:DnaJ domain-containing protein [Xylaria palmicola]|nr:DnaJ domain-containing protein [Xylaria palmicola]
MTAQNPDYCAILQVRRGASNEELNAAYRRLALVHHPDKNKGNEAAATAKFQEVRQAYEALSNPEKHQPHDASGGPQYSTRTTAAASNSNAEENPFAWFDRSWGSSFGSRWADKDGRRDSWGRVGGSDWFDEKSWRPLGFGFTAHPRRLFTYLPPMAPFELRMESRRRNGNRRERRMSFRLFSQN